MKTNHIKRVPADGKGNKIEVFGRKTKIAPVTGRGRLFSLHPRYMKVERHAKTWSSFRITLTAAMVLGLPISPSLWKTKLKAVDSLIVAWNHCMIFVRTLLIVAYLSNSRRLLTTLSTRMSFDLQILVGYAPIWIFCWNGKRIESSLKKLLSKFPDLSAEEGRRSPSIKTGLLLCTLVLAMFVWTAWKFFYCSEAFDSIAERLNPGVSLLQDVHYYFTSAVIFSYIFSYYAGTATLYVQLLFSSLAYWSCSRLLRSYGEELQKRMETTPLTVDAMSRMLAKFKSVSSCIEDLDKTLGECPLVIYLYVMNDVFTGVSTLFPKERKYGSIEYDLFLSARALTAIAMFLYLTHNADAVAREKKSLQRRMVGVSHSVMRPTTSLHLASVFENLYGSIKSTELCITCSDLFVITRKITLSGVGVFITYGFYLYQYAAAERK